MKKINAILVLALGLTAVALHRGHSVRVPFWFDPAIPVEPDRPVPPIPPPTVVVALPVMPSGEGPVELTVRPAQGKVVRGASRVLPVHLELEGRSQARPDRLPIDVALVMDRSGSMMARGKLAYARDAAKLLTRKLGPGDRLAVVSFDQVSRILRPLAEVTDLAELDRVIDDIVPGGSTNLYDGLRDGATEVARSGDGLRVRRVLLLTDGLASFGETDPAVLTDLAKDLGQKGISVTTLGMGHEYNEDLLVDLAEFSGGNYHFLGRPESITAIYASEVADLTTVVARAVWLKVEVPAGVEIRDVLGPKGFFLEDRQLTIPFGDVYSGQKRNVVLNLALAGDRPVDGSQLVTARLACHDAAAGDRPVSITRIGAVEFTESAADAESSMDPRVMERVESFHASQKLEEAMGLLSRGERRAAQDLLREQARKSRSVNERVIRSPRLTEQLSSMEATAGELDGLEGDTDTVSTYVKQQKWNAYLMAR